MTDVPERIWSIDLDGTGSMHPCLRGDPGAVEYIRADLVPQWQPIETLPAEIDPEQSAFLVFDGVGVWKAWRQNGEICGFEVDGEELPQNDWLPTHWMPLPSAPDTK